MYRHKKNYKSIFFLWRVHDSSNNHHMHEWVSCGRRGTLEVKCQVLASRGKENGYRTSTKKMTPWRKSLPNLQPPSVCCESDSTPCIISSFAKLSNGAPVGEGHEERHAWTLVCVSGARGSGFPLRATRRCAFPTPSERARACAVPEKTGTLVFLIVDMFCSTRFNSVAFLCLCRDLWRLHCHRQKVLTSLQSCAQKHWCGSEPPTHSFWNMALKKMAQICLLWRVCCLSRGASSIFF